MINKAAVIGAGTMGAGIAAHFANAGIPVYLMDIEPKGIMDRMRKHKPPMFFTPDVAQLVTVGPVNDEWIAAADWIIEAIFENLDAKRELVARIDRARKSGSIVTSNTSGLPIAQLSSDASADFRKHFLGTHFFNPPRYMKLLELIPTPDTSPEITAFVREFAEHRLGKSVVVCKDTPNFIANRLASMGGATLMDFVLARDYTIEEVDAIAGPLIGRPKTAAFRLIDLVGLDVSASVQSNLHGLIPHDESRDVLVSPRFEELRKKQIDRGRLGDKTRQGFYRKDGKTIETLDLSTGEYRPRQEPEIASLAEAAKIPNLSERLRFVLAQDDKAGALARHVVYHALGYASRRVPEISDDVISIDRATRWGFSHDLGPFELWDLLGVNATADAMEANGVAVAPWVREMLARGNGSFYRGGEMYDMQSKSYVPTPRDPKHIAHDDEVLFFHGGNLRDAIAEVERGHWKGLVIVVGPGTPSDALMSVRFCSKPVVAAVLGASDAADLAMSASRIVAASETYLRVIPGAGGCKELVRRVVSRAMKQTPNADPLPYVQNVLETIAMMKVSSSAADARTLGFLSDADRIVMNSDHVLYEAKQEVLAMAADGYAPPPREKNCYAAGRDVYAAIKTGIHMLQQGGYVRAEDAQRSARLARVLCGGNLSSPQWVDEQYFVDLECQLSPLPAARGEG